MGKLDTVTVNGPEGEVVDWDAVDWRQVEDDVRRLRQRIFTATQAGDLKKVRNLQKLMLRSRANALLSVRRVTEVNAGRKTAGVDGRVVLDGLGEGRDGHLAFSAVRPRGGPGRSSGCSSRRPDGKQRGLGIPVIADRALQALTVGALEPEWEARFESRSYGFRPGRSLPGRDAGDLRDRTRRDVQAPVGAGRRPGRRVRPDRSLPPPRPARHVPRPGTDRAVAEGGSDRSGPVRPDRAGQSARRGDQPGADERGPARDGGGRRSPLHPHRQQCRDGEAGLTGR